MWREGGGGGLHSLYSLTPLRTAAFDTWISVDICCHTLQGVNTTSGERTKTTVAMIGDNVMVNTPYVCMCRIDKNPSGIVHRSKA